MKNNKILLISIFLLGCILRGNAQSGGQIAINLEEKSQTGSFTVYNDLLQVTDNFDASLISNEVSDATVFDLDKAKALELIEQQPDLISIKINSSMTLDLYRETAAFSSLSVTTSDGELFDPSSLKAVFYRGTIQGNGNSVVSLSIFENEIAGFIADSDGNRVLGKLRNADQIILYNAKDLKNPPNFNCSMPELPMTAAELENYATVASKSLTHKCVRLYFETEYDIFQSLGSSVPNVAAYVTNLYNQVGTLYANDGITTTLSNITVWVGTDPYTATNTSSLLSQFQAQTSSINGDLGELITFRNIGGGQAAGFSGICNSNVDQSLCVAGNLTSSFANVPTYSWEAMVVTHEFGHLFGSRHTHACVWNGNGTAIDGCAGATEGGCPLPGIPAGGGTMMSYCHLTGVGINFLNGFGPQPTAVITNNVNNGACLSSCCVADLIITANVTAPNANYKQAQNTITATNTIDNGATGIYHAGSQLAFQNGFYAATGCDFRAYVEGCTDQFVIRSRTPYPYPDATSSYENLILAPNPTTGVFSVNLKEAASGIVQIFDIRGTLVYKKAFNSEARVEVDLQDKPQGVYIVKVFTDKANMVGKITKN